ncbi:MAG: hypothetical protein KKF44_03250 [Nanoarchaeota archaeon]|nr:hypothetical protein [Nanoarchaeota archaeon]
MEQKEIRRKISEGFIHFRAIVEVMGKPKEHVKKTLDEYIKKIKDSEELIFIKADLEKPEKQEESGLYLAFAEVEILVKNAQDILGFCFDYMPSSIEVIEPEQFLYSAFDFTAFVNDVQARLHAVNMAMQEFRQKEKSLLENTATLLRNFVTALLVEKKTISELKTLTGLKEIELEKLLAALEKEGRIKKEGEYFLLNKNA